MAKTYIDTVKYVIHLDFEIKGVVEKPDIVGAIFGQSEGLLGEEMDLRELQKNGRIGRIEVNVQQSNGTTRGELLVPSSMDMVQTSILAAAIETVDKVGPCESVFKTIKIEDTRVEKRKEITERAKDILSKFMTSQMPETQEIAQEVRHQARASEIQEFGKGKLPAGPEVGESESIIVVEGRADVVNLLKHGIKNVVGMDGSKIQQEIIDLSKRKTVVLFVDGDRGGQLNARKFNQVAKVDFVAQAPDGKEVEELTQKEIIQSLRRKMETPAYLEQAGAPREKSYQKAFTKRGPLHSYDAQKSFEEMPVENAFIAGTPASTYRERPLNRMGRDRRSPRRDSRGMRGRNPRFGNQGFKRGPRPMGEPGFERPGFGSEIAFEEASNAPLFMEEARATPEEQQAFKPFMETLKGTLKAKLLDSSLNELASVNVKELVKKIQGMQNVHAIVFDGIITKRLLEEAEKNNVKYLVGVKKGKLQGSSTTKTIALDE
ncbi:MAG: DNA primase [Candidatus Diapherotrites archaeon]|nr:DNA primase [Candidatus Diapherotrites archaeon]